MIYCYKDRNFLTKYNRNKSVEQNKLRLIHRIAYRKLDGEKNMNINNFGKLLSIFLPLSQRQKPRKNEREIDE